MSDLEKNEKILSEVAKKLQEYGATEEVAEKAQQELGVETVEDIAMLDEKDLTGIGMKTIQARKLLASLKKAETASAETTPPAAAIGAASLAYESILPSVPDDESWLKSLKAGGVLKVDQSSIISAIRAALAYKVGLFDVPGKLVAAMEKFADENDESVDISFFSLSKQITRRSYADIFSAIDGLSGDFVTEKRKKQLFDRMNQFFFPAVSSFYGALKSWQEAWMQGAANPAVLVMAMMSRSATMPTGMVQAPDTGILRDSADAVNDSINKTFAGMGVVVSAALAYDATQIRNTLQDPKLPALIGAANRDQMLKMIGAAVNATYPRLEQNLIRFILGVLQVNDQTAGDEELQYFSALAMLGSQIQFEQLGFGTSGITGIGGRQL